MIIIPKINMTKRIAITIIMIIAGSFPPSSIGSIGPGATYFSSSFSDTLTLLSKGPISKIPSDIISEIVKGSVKANLVDNNIEVTLNADDLKKLKDGFIAKLQKEIKQPITFKSSDGISSGFTISFDDGKSCFDFSDASLIEYLGSYLNAKVAALLSE